MRGSIDRRTAALGDLRKVRDAAALATPGDKIGGLLADTMGQERIGLIVKRRKTDGRAALGRCPIEDPFFGRRVGEIVRRHIEGR